VAEHLAQATPLVPSLDSPLPPEEELPPEPILDVETPSLLTPAVPAPAPPDQVLVQRLVVEGSTVFSEAELAAAVAPFEGRLLTLEELQQAADAVTQIYLNAGYLTSEAVVPPQDVADGLVRLRVIEGFLEEIRVEGSDRLANYVRQRVALAGAAPVSQARLEDQLRLLQTDSLFDNVEAGLRQGSMEGGSILTVRVSEAPAFSGSLTLDTLSPRSVGQLRTGATLRYQNLVGLGDRLQASAYRSTTGGAYAYDLSYQIPITPQNGTLLLRLAPNNYRITDTSLPEFALDLQGSADSYEAVVRQPLIRTSDEEFALSAGFRYRQGSTLLLGFITPPTITSVFSFGQDYVRRDASGTWGLQSQFRLGTGLFNASVAPTGPEAKFWSWQGQVQRWQVINPNHRLLIQGGVQLTTDSLLGSEQFVIGGAQSVRGYYQNQRFGDNGLRFSIEDYITLQRDNDGRPITRLIPFFDVGYVWATNADLAATQQNWMVGTGMAVEAQLLDNLSARVDFGVPLVTLDELPGDRPSGLRIYFDMRYRF
jgi:hemolysin activation/secretion protein